MTALPKFITIGDKYAPAMEITEQAKADAYFELLVDHAMNWQTSREEAAVVERDNLAYFAAYYGNDARERVEHLFQCAHPFFGAIAKVGPPTPDEALKMGMEMAKRSR